MLSKIILLSAMVMTAIMAGLFFAWSFSVMLGLAKLTDREFVAAMQSMNREIQNPVFFSVFFGAPIFLILATVFNYRSGSIFGILLAAAIIYLVGVMGVTFVGNIPLNNALDAFQMDTATAQEISRHRADFENPWVRLNFVRTLSSIISIVLLAIACIWRNEN